MDNKMFELVHVRELASVFNRDVYGLSFVSGMIFRNNFGTVLNSFVAPYIHIDRIMPDVIFEELPPKKRRSDTVKD